MSTSFWDNPHALRQRAGLPAQDGKRDQIVLCPCPTYRGGEAHSGIEVAAEVALVSHALHDHGTRRKHVPCRTCHDWN